FFQAEDGIRDRNVTGVQTCALPISVIDVLIVMSHDRDGWDGSMNDDIYVLGGAQTDFARNWAKEGLGLVDMLTAVLPATFADSRSEERRVGKECSSQRTKYSGKAEQ